MYNNKSEWDKGFDKGMKIGSKLGFIEGKIQGVSSALSDISEKLNSEGAVIAGVIIDIDDCIGKLEDTMENLSSL